MKTKVLAFLIAISFYTLSIEAQVTSQIDYNSAINSTMNEKNIFDSLIINHAKFVNWNKKQRLSASKLTFVKLDSTLSYVGESNPIPVKVLNSKDIYEYDSYGRNTEQTSYSYYDTVWYPQFNYAFHYNSNGNCDTIMTNIISYDTLNDISFWKFNNYSTYYYDSENRDTSVITHYMNAQSGNIELWSKEVYTYNDSNQYTSIRDFRRGNNGWLELPRYLWTYNNLYQKKTESKVQYYADSAKWFVTEKLIYTYDSLNREDSLYVLHLDQVSMILDIVFVAVNNYDSLGNVDIIKGFNYLGQNVYDLAVFQKQSFNQDGFMLESKLYTSNSNNWFAKKKNVFQYDSLNQNISEQEYTRGTETSNWFGRNMSNKSYSYNYLNEEVSLPILNLAVGNEYILAESSLYVNNISEWAFHSKSIFYYSSSDVSINNIQKLSNKLLIKPNPVGDNLNISIDKKDQKIKEINIFDMLGKEVMRVKIDDYLYTYNVSLLKTGVYIIYVHLDNDEVLAKKIIKK